MTALSTTQYDSKTVEGWLDLMIPPLLTLLHERQPTAMIGIRRGGVIVGKRLLEKLIAQNGNLEPQLGELNIAFYRDDFSSMGLHPVVGPSEVPFAIQDRHIILVDDVLATGRTVRAAMNEIFDYGRPASISLAVLVQRFDHELPIRADIVGQHLQVNAQQYIDLDADSMQLRVGDKP